jgi:hypothetical protein
VPKILDLFRIRKARGKETTRKTDGPFRDRIECCGLDWSGSG